MKLSEIKGERALEVIADLIDPIATLAADEKVAALFKGEKRKDEDNKAYTIRQVKTHLPYLLKKHKKSVIEIMAALEGVSATEYTANMNLLTLPKQLLEMLNDEALLSLFTSAELTEVKKHVGSASTKPGV